MPERLSILQHALGLDAFGRGGGGRNYFVTGPGNSDYDACMAMVDAGLMTRSPGNEITGGDDCFRVTDPGRVYVAAHSPVRPAMTRGQKRYKAFLDADCGLKFGEFLRSRYYA